MAHNLVLLLVAFLLATLSLADGNFDNTNIELVESVMEGRAARAVVDPVLVPRNVVTVTVTHTVCEPILPTFPGTSPVFSIPETTLISGTPPAPTVGQPPASPSAPLETSTVPAVGPTTASESPTTTSEVASPSSSTEHTTIQTTSTTSGHSAEAPTETSTSTTSHPAPTVNAASAGPGKGGAVLALGLALVRYLAV